MNSTEYVLELLREARRLHPPPSDRLNHAITFDPDDNDALVFLLCVGDVLYRHKINSADLSDDPIATAARVVARAKKESWMDGEPAHHW